MSDATRGTDGPHTPQQGEAIPSDSEPGSKDGGEPTARNLAPWEYYDDGYDDGYVPPTIPEFAAQSRVALEGATEDGQSPVFIQGEFRFVTPCHVPGEGLRASNICPVCFGDLKRPVATATTLACGHWTSVDFSQGERRIQCQVPGCEEWSVLTAERVIVTRYTFRPLPGVEL